MGGMHTMITAAPPPVRAENPGMNHLAHALLAGDDDGLRLGGMLGAFEHGKPDPARFPPRVIDGIRLHRAIDVYTDAHPEGAEARRLLPSPYRRARGINVEVGFG